MMQLAVCHALVQAPRRYRLRPFSASTDTNNDPYDEMLNQATIVVLSIFIHWVSYPSKSAAMNQHRTGTGPMLTVMHTTAILPH